MLGGCDITQILRAAKLCLSLRDLRAVIERLSFSDLSVDMFDLRVVDLKTAVEVAN